MKKYLLTLTCFLLACSPNYKTVVLNDYASKRIDGASLVIAPISNLTVDYIGSVEEEFGKGDQQTLIKKHFKTTFLHNLQNRSSFSSVIYDEYTTLPHFSVQSLDMDDFYKVEIDLPSDTVPITFTKTTPDFILFISNLYLGTEMYGEDYGYNVTPSSTPYTSITYQDVPDHGLMFTNNYSNFTPPMPVYNPMPFTSSYYAPPKFKYLRYKCDFAYWDNKLHKLVAYGRVCAKAKSESHGFGMVEIIRLEHWREIDANFFNSMLGNTPFFKRRASQEIFVPQEEDTLQ